MNSVIEKARAKLNLTLDVVGIREDGYHEMRMVMQSVDLSDEVELTRREGPLEVETNKAYLPKGEENLAYKAAVAYMDEAGLPKEGVKIYIRKRIPVCAGLGGGSADAAAVLRGLGKLMGAELSDESMQRAAERVGSDVAFCVRGGTKLAEGRGEKLKPVRGLPECVFLICKPEFSVSTPKLFSRLDSINVCQHPDTEGMVDALEAGNLREVACRCFNVFESALPPRERHIVEEVKGELLTEGALVSCMTGTGSAVYGLFQWEADARSALLKLRRTCAECFLAYPE